MDRIRRISTPLGPVVLASDGGALTGLWFEGQRHFGARLSAKRADRKEGCPPVFGEAARWLEIYFGGGIPDFTPPLSLSGTPFQRKVWACLLTVPYGERISYGELARMLGRGAAGETDLRTAVREAVPPKPVSARAVGGAVGRNPVSLIVPCHRVVGADGSVTGYAGGVWRKLRLLELEAGVLC